MKIQFIKKQATGNNTYTVSCLAEKENEKKFLESLQYDFDVKANGIIILPHVVINAGKGSMSFEINTNAYERLPNSVVFMPSVYIKRK